MIDSDPPFPPEAIEAVAKTIFENDPGYDKDNWETLRADSYARVIAMAQARAVIALLSAVEGEKGSSAAGAAPLPLVVELANGVKLRIGGMFKLVYQQEFLQIAGPVKGYTGADRRAAQLIREAWNKLPDTPSLGDIAFDAAGIALFSAPEQAADDAARDGARVSAASVANTSSWREAIEAAALYVFNNASDVRDAMALRDGILALSPPSQESAARSEHPPRDRREG